jgi:hypothetical protein
MFIHRPLAALVRDAPVLSAGAKGQAEGTEFFVLGCRPIKRSKTLLFFDRINRIYRIFFVFDSRMKSKTRGSAVAKAMARQVRCAQDSFALVSLCPHAHHDFSPQAIAVSPFRPEREKNILSILLILSKAFSGACALSLAPCAYSP